MRLRPLALLLLAALPIGARAQGASAAAAPTVAALDPVPPQEPGRTIEKKLGPADIIMPHITDSKHMEIPWVNKEWAREITLPTWNVTIGGRQVDLGPTKHVVFELIAAIIVAVLLIWAAAAHERHTREEGRPKGFAAGLEAVVLYLRDEIFLPVLGGHGGERYVPFVLSLFFFILFCNLFGLIPYGSTPTGNIGVTATLAAVTFIVIETAGMRTLGKGYFGTIVYWPHDMPLYMKLPLSLIMTPVELIGKFTKPFALTVRLFANMIAGHVIILALIGLIFLFGWGVAIGSVAMALFIMLLEILVAFIQAFIFALLAAVFIGQIRMSHH